VQCIVCDVSALTDVDEATVEHLARLQLIAHRFGLTMVLQNASPRLVDLLALVGLDGVLPVVEVDRQVEEGEQRGIDEEVDTGDAAL
jgi:anti-anti-sigma regulatory factor